MSLHQQQPWFVRGLFVSIPAAASNDHEGYTLTEREATVPSSIHYRAWPPHLDTGVFPPAR